MTEGHRLAVDQLRAIEEGSCGAFEIVDLADQPDAKGFLCLDINFDCANRPHAEGGAQLKRREWFRIALPADFPYKLPEVRTRHARFAGLPHVQWKHVLCLYQAPSTEWNAGDGMYGYITRLSLWLDHAAAGQLNPSGEALHPPVAYTSDTLRIVIPRANAPAVSADNWIGFAKLDRVSDVRADIGGWLSLSDIGEAAPLAPAFLLAESLPFEYPGKIADLFTEMAKRGVSTQLVISALRVAVLMNPESAPLYVIIGTPMRGIAGTGIRQYHLAAWYIDTTIVQGLRSSLSRFNPDPRISELGRELEEIIVAWLKQTDVEWCLVREDRPEIVTPRDRGTGVEWFKGKAITLWGCGALGSYVADFLTRAGVRKLILFDNGAVAPGILARQLYSDDDIGFFKVSALFKRLKAIRPGIEIEVHPINLLSGQVASESLAAASDAIIDTTASSSLMLKTEEALRTAGSRPPIVAMAIGHQAHNAVLLVSRADHSGGTFDVDRKLRLECGRRPELKPYADEFWPRQARTEIFQPEPGCSDATFVGSGADVAFLASAMVNLAATELASTDSAAAAHLLSQPSVAPASPHKRFTWPPDSVLQDRSSKFEIRIARAAWSELTAWISANDRVRGARVETGGLLFGERNDLLKIAWADEVTGPPPDSSHAATGFVCGIQGTKEIAAAKAIRTGGLVRFLGMWHTHPGGNPLPSHTDIKGIETLVEATQSRRGKSLMLIVGGGLGGDHLAAAYVFSAQDFEQMRESDTVRLCSIHAPAGRLQEKRLGLALSGGGSRAIAFHLGCLRALHDRGLTDQVKVVSAVSGGAVIAAMYAYSEGSFEDFERSVVRLLERGLQREILLQLGKPTQAIATVGTVTVAGSIAAAADITRLSANFLHRSCGIRSEAIIEFTKTLQPPLRRWASTTTAFERALRERLFGSARMDGPRRNGVEVVLNACDLRSGSAFRFGSRESGCWRYGVVTDNAVEVAHAVAASAAYPALLPALDEVVSFTARDGSTFKKRVLLTDGGVYDNLGVSCLEPGTAGEVGYNHFSPEYIVCCDAGQGILQDHPIPYLWGARMARSFEAVFRKAQNATQNRLHILCATGGIKGFILAYLGQIDRRVPEAPADLVKREAVNQYPTDFARMDRRTIERIAKRGEQLTRALITHYCPEL